MRAALTLAGRALVLATIGLLLVAGLLPGELELAARIYALVVAAAVLGVALAALRRAYPPAAPLRAMRTGGGAVRTHPPTLLRLEQACVLGIARSFDFHYRLRPRLREIAAARLAARHGVILDAKPEAARRILGDEAWELVRADRPAPEDRLARGVPAGELRSLVEKLEGL